MKRVHLSRPEPLEFVLLGGRSFIVQPVSRAQMRAALALDPEPGEVRTPAQCAEQRAGQVAALVGETVEVPTEGGVQTVPARTILATLTADEEMQVLGAIMAQGHGQDPVAHNAIHSLSKKKALLTALCDSPILTAILSNSPTSSDAQQQTPKDTDSSIA